MGTQIFEVSNVRAFSTAQAKRSKVGARVPLSRLPPSLLPHPFATGRIAVRIDERSSVAHDPSIPQPRVARRMPTVELPPPEEGYPRNFIVEQPKHNVSELHFEKFPTPSTFLYWKTNFKTGVRSGLGHPSEATPWNKKKFGKATSVDDLKTSRSICGRIYPNFETLHARIATAQKKISQMSNFKRKVHLEKLEARKELFDFSDLMGVTLRGGDVRGF